MKIQLEISYFTRLGKTPKGFTIEVINRILNNSFVDIPELINYLDKIVGQLEQNILIYGRGGSHVWISDKQTGERIVLIKFR